MAEIRNQTDMHARPSRVKAWLLRAGPHAIILFGIFAVAILWLSELYFSHRARIEMERSAFSNASNLARTFEEQIIRAIRMADQTLLYVRDSYARDPEHFDIALWSQYSTFLSDLTFQVSIVDKQGIMVASNIAGSAHGTNLRDREHIAIHMNRKLDELFISKPVLGRISQKWSIQLTRRITMPNGEFGGVVVVSLDPYYLTKFYQSIDIGSKGVIALAGTDGIVRARGTNGPSKIGEDLSNSLLFNRLQQSPEGAFLGKSTLDGVSRMFSYRTVKGYPLVVSVGLAEDEVFNAFNQRTRADFVGVALLSCLLLVMTAVIARFQQSLARALDAANAGARARTEFLAMMSHEIRTPMNGVVGISELLLNSGLKDDQLSYVKTMRQSTEHLMQIINDVLDFSKLDADRLEMEHVSFDLHDVVRGTVQLLTLSAEEKGLQLGAVMAADVPRFIEGDPARIRQVLFNLVGNGLKFTERGSVSIRVSLEHKHFQNNHLRLMFEVADTGIGIPQDAMPMLFQKFSQVDGSVARRFGGTGLGLAICQRLVSLMGGSISVESELGRGTTFRFTIDCEPSVENEATSVVALSDSPATSPAELSATEILLVEDNKTNRMVVMKMLEQLGYRADVATNGVEAVFAASHKLYDLILMDVMMPEMDGLTATRTIRALQKPFSGPRIVALTANAMKHDQEACRDAGMDDFLSKPITIAKLSEKLSPQGIQSKNAALPSIGSNTLSYQQVFDREIYGELAAAIGADDAAAVLRTFLSDTTSRVTMMKSSSDAAFIGREAHAIKSSAAMLGFSQLSSLARALEANAAQASEKTNCQAIFAIEKTLEEARSASAQLLENADSERSIEVCHA